jgi:hypothetical protein
MNSSYPLLRQMRLFLADQERALRAASLAQASRSAAPELRALYTRHVDPPEPPTRARAGETGLTVSTAVQLPAS